MKRRHNILLAGMLAVAVAFGVAIPLGFWISSRYSGAGDWGIGAMLVVVLVGIPFGVMRL